MGRSKRGGVKPAKRSGRKNSQRFQWPKAGVSTGDIRRTSIVQIDWLDACGQHGWRPAKEDLGLVPCTSVGFLLHRKRDHITICQGLTNTQETQSLESIPRKWIQRVRVIQRGK